MDEDDIIQNEISGVDATMQFLTIGWKVLFATIPPSNIMGGGPAFFCALTYIGVITFIVGEFATVLGCALGIEESVSAITLVALGTSLPDTFASMAAANGSPNADAAVGNITGSNAVNVFLGLGIPWGIATVYHQSTFNRPYIVKAGPLAFSVVVFLICAIICFGVLIIRRKLIGGELGGTKLGKWSSGCFLFLLWFIYILMSTLQAYKVI